MPSLFGGRKKAYVFNGTAAPNTRSCWSQDNEAESGSQIAPRLSLAFGFGEEPPQPPSLPRVPKPPKMPPPSLPDPCEVDNSSKIQKPEQSSETIRKTKRPSSASRATAAVSAAWSAARAALNSTAASPRTSSQQKDSKGPENGQTDKKTMFAEDSQHTEVRNGSTKSQKQQVIALAREEDCTDTQLELNILTNKLVAAVYDRSLSESEIAAVLRSCPEVSWLAQCAQNAPSPVGWQRCGCLPGSDGDLVLCYANTSTDEVIETTPLLENFAELAKLAVHAVVNSKGASNAARWVSAARDAALKEAAKAQEGWSGPHVDEQSGEEFYYCTSTGCSSWTSPAAAHAYVAHVAQQLLQSHIFPEHIDDTAPSHRKQTRGPERKLARETIDRKPKDYPNKVGANGYVAETGTRQADDIAHQKERRRHDRSRKQRSSPAKSHGSGSMVNDEISNTTKHLPSGYEKEHTDTEALRMHRRGCENRLRVPRPSPARSNVSESLDSDIASSASCVPIGSGRHRNGKAASNPMFFEIHSDESDSMSCESVKPERAPRRQKQKRRVSSGTNDSCNQNNTTESTNNKAAAALAGAAAALSAAAVALAGLDKNGTAKETVHVDSLLAAASALRGAGSDPPIIPSTTVESNRKRLSKTNECKMQSEIPRLALERLQNAELEPDYPKGDAATGRYTLAHEANTLDLDDTSEKEEYEEADFPPSSNQTRVSIDEEPKLRPSKLSPLPPEVRNAANTHLQGAIDAKTLLEYAEEAAAGDTPTSSATSRTVLNAERQEAIAVAESALKAAFDHSLISSHRPSIEEEQCPQPMTQEGEEICNQELEKACDDKETRVPRKRVSVGGA